MLKTPLPLLVAPERYERGFVSAPPMLGGLESESALLPSFPSLVSRVPKLFSDYLVTRTPEIWCLVPKRKAWLGSLRRQIFRTFFQDAEYVRTDIWRRACPISWLGQLYFGLFGFRWVSTGWSTREDIRGVSSRMGMLFNDTLRGILSPEGSLLRQQEQREIEELRLQYEWRGEGILRFDLKR